MHDYIISTSDLPPALYKNILAHTEPCEEENSNPGVCTPRLFDPLNQTLSMDLSFELEVTENLCEDFGSTSPLFAKLDAYYEAVCSRVAPHSAPWGAARPIMFAQMDQDLLPYSRDVGRVATVYYLTKWLVRLDQMVAIREIIEDTGLIAAHGMSLELVYGVMEDGPEPGGRL